MRRTAQPAGPPTRDGAGIGVWERWRGRARQGAGVFVYHLVRRARARCRLAHLFDLQVHECVAVPSWRLRLPPRPARGLQVGELAPVHVPHLERLRQAVGAPYAQRFDAAHRCLGAWLEGRLVAFVWLQPGPGRLPSMLGCTWLLPASLAWVYDIYSDPQVLGAAPQLYAYLRQHPLDATVRVLAGHTELDNRRSRLAHRSLGYEGVGILVSVQLAGLRFHLSRGLTTERWRAHRGDAVISLQGVAAQFEGGVGRSTDRGLRVQCRCGRCVEVGAGPLTCACGRAVGARREGMIVLGTGARPPSELSWEAAERLLARAEQVGWRAAAEEGMPATLLEYACSPQRAAFHELLPLANGARVLELGANWGGTAAPLARRYRVVAVVDEAPQARFLALRKRQEGLEHLEVVLADPGDAPLAGGQFDAVIANGVLAWAGAPDGWGQPRDMQLAALSRWRDLLAPGGFLYLASENRFGRERDGAARRGLLLRGLTRALGGLRPRWADGPRAHGTQTYSYRGYRRLFAEGGFRVAAAWVSPGGYNRPDRLFPLRGTAIQYARPATTGTARTWLRRASDRAWVWRWLGSDFVFLLAPVPAMHRAWPARKPATRAAGSPDA